MNDGAEVWAVEGEDVGVEGDDVDVEGEGVGVVGEGVGVDVLGLKVGDCVMGVEETEEGTFDEG